MAEKNVCYKCGGPKRDNEIVCGKCQVEHSKQGSKYSTNPSHYQQHDCSDAKLPNTCIFESFYEGNYLRKEIFLDAAKTVASVFEQQKMSQGSLRHLFQMLKAVDNQMKADKSFELGAVNEVFYKFLVQAHYQMKRDIVKSSFIDLIERHKEIVTKSKEEFRGFVSYLTSIMAYLKPKN